MSSAKTQSVARMGLLFALAIALSWLESLVPLPGAPGVKLGLSNIVTLYCVTAIGPLSALALAALKAMFALTRSGVAAAMSAAGGLCSVCVMLITSRHFSRVFCSICGGVSHNIAQLSVAALIMRSALSFYYLPVLIISGVIMGLITGSLLTTVEPVVRRALRAPEEKNNKQAEESEP